MFVDQAAGSGKTTSSAAPRTRSTRQSKIFSDLVINGDELAKLGENLPLATERIQ